MKCPVLFPHPSLFVCLFVNKCMYVVFSYIYLVCKDENSEYFGWVAMGVFHLYHISEVMDGRLVSWQ